MAARSSAGSVLIRARGLSWLEQIGALCGHLWLPFAFIGFVVAMEVGSEAWAFTPVWLPDVPKFAMPATTVHIGVSNVPMNVEAGDSRNSLLESEHVIDVDCRREGTAGIKYLARRRWNYANVVRQFCIRWEYNGEWNYRHPVNPDPQFVSGRGTKISNLYQDKIVVDVAVRWWIGRHPTKVIKVRKDERYLRLRHIRAQLATFRPLNGINTPFQLVALPKPTAMRVIVAAARAAVKAASATSVTFTSHTVLRNHSSFSSLG